MSAPLPPATESGLLTCWKEIAAFFGKGVRTVQRWEQIGMPVHRPTQDRAMVFAVPEELRQWALKRHGKQEKSSSSHRMLSVLAVDDNEIQSYAIEKTLKHLGYNVVSVRDGASAVEQAASANFDAILLDIHLPDMNGPEVCRRIRILDAIQQPAIVSYSGVSPDLFPQFQDGGADAFLTFPVEPFHLSAVIEGATRKRRTGNSAA